MSPTQLFIIDDHKNVREALKARLDAVSDCEVVGCTDCWKTGLEQVQALKPDVVLLETKRADGEGLEALRRLTNQCEARVIILTSYVDAEERTKAQCIGADHYLLKDIDTSLLVRTIQET